MTMMTKFDVPNFFRTVKSLGCVVGGVLVAWSAASCGDGGTGPEAPPNQAPVAAGTVPVQTITEGERQSVDVRSYFSDPDGDALTYSARSSATGVATVSVSGSTVAITAVSPGEASVTVTAADPGGLSAAQSFAVTVERANRAPVTAGTIPAQTVTEGESQSVDVESYFSDPDGDVLTYSATSSATGVATVSVSGSTVAITAVSPGEASVTVTATDPGGLSVAHSFVVTVEQANQAPVAAGTVPAQTVTEGESQSVDVESYFSDPDGDTLTYSASSSATGVATVSVSGSTVAITAVSPGEASVTVTATDPGGLSAAQSFVVTVERANQAPVAAGTVPAQTVTKGDSQSVNVESYFSDPDGDTLTYSASSSAPGVATVSVSGSTVAITAVSLGEASVTVTATDPGGLSAVQSFAVKVEQAADICGRTPQVRDAIMAVVGKSVCADVTGEDLARIRALSLEGISALKSGDFGGLSNLESLWLWYNDLTELPAGVFGGLSNLESLNLSDNDLTELPAGVFGGLTSLWRLDLSFNDLTELPAGVFGGLSSLELLRLGFNELTELPAGVFGGLSRLESLDLNSNELTELPAGVFGGLSRLESLDLNSNELAELPAGVFGGLTSLEWLDLSSNELAELPAGVFGGLTSLWRLDLSSNELAELPAGVFGGAVESSGAVAV